MNINGRIKEVREYNSLNQEEFSYKIKVGRSTLAQFEIGTRNPKDIHIKQICLEFNISEEWLRHGDGLMFVETTESVIADLTKQFNLDGLDQIIIMEYAKLKPEQRKAIKQYLDNVISNKNFDNPSEEVSSTNEDDDIEVDVESFRQELLAEKKGHSALPNTAERENMS